MMRKSTGRVPMAQPPGNDTRALPMRAKEWVMPWPKPRQPGRVQLDMARVAVGKVAPSPTPSMKRTKMNDQKPPASPVPMVEAAQISPHTHSTRRGPYLSPIRPPMIWNMA